MAEINFYAGSQYLFEYSYKKDRFDFLRQLLHGEGRDILLTDQQTQDYMKELDSLTDEAIIIVDPIVVE